MGKERLAKTVLSRRLIYVWMRDTGNFGMKYSVVLSQYWTNRPRASAQDSTARRSKSATSRCSRSREPLSDSFRSSGKRSRSGYFRANSQSISRYRPSAPPSQISRSPVSGECRSQEASSISAWCSQLSFPGRSARSSWPLRWVSDSSEPTNSVSGSVRNPNLRSPQDPHRKSTRRTLVGATRW